MKKRTRLAEARYRMGWSQEEAAEQAGVTRATFSQWERGVYDPYPLHVHRLCELFGKTAEELDLTRTPQETSQTEEPQQPSSPESKQESPLQELPPLLSQTITQNILQTFAEVQTKDINTYKRNIRIALHLHRTSSNKYRSPDRRI